MSEEARPDLQERLQALASEVESDHGYNEAAEKLVIDLREAAGVIVEAEELAVLIRNRDDGKWHGHEVEDAADRIFDRLAATTGEPVIE